MAHKRKVRPVGEYDAKAEIIRKHGTIAAFIRKTGNSPATVYAALRGRRNGPKSRQIRAIALG